MSAASDYLEDAILDHIFDNAAYTAPGAIYVGLFTADSGQLEVGTLTNEVSGNGYAREVGSFDDASGGSTSNTANITFAAATGNWGTITHVALLDAETGGNVLFWGAVTTSKTIETGDTFQISTGNLTISLA
jgi:hypothetical protein